MASATDHAVLSAEGYLSLNRMYTGGQNGRMSRSTIPAPDQTILRAPAYGLLLGQTACHFCLALTPTAAVWVSSFEERDEEGVVDQGEGALLRYIERLDDGATAFVTAHAAWLRYASTRTSGQVYLAHHCTTCGALQGDHFVFSPDGPYWPQDDVALSVLRFIQGLGPLTAQASAGQSGWMDRVPAVCERQWPSPPNDESYARSGQPIPAPCKLGTSK